MSRAEMQLRPVTADDARMVADLGTARTPDDPQDAEMIAFWWTCDPEVDWAKRQLSERSGVIDVFVEATHEEWHAGDICYGRVLASIHPDTWTETLYQSGIATAEDWLRAEGADVSVASVREDFTREIDVLTRLGYRKTRIERYWELDLVEHRASLLSEAERSRDRLRRQGIDIVTLDRVDRPDVLQQIYDLDHEASRDIPTTVPISRLSYERWSKYYLENPGIRKDRFWIARVGDEVVGMSLIVFPPGRGVPETEFTGTSPRFRGRGIARALKYETVAQAIAIGATRVRTDNDSENAPILRINADMRYRPITPYVELHRELPSERE